jgi:hypothetical protein
MTQFRGKNAKINTSSSDSKRHFTVVIGGKEHGLYVSSTPSSAAKKAVTKLCTANKSKKVEFSIREITQGSKKKTYGPYTGHIEKLKEPIELKSRVIRYKPVAKLSGKSGKKMKGGGENNKSKSNNGNPAADPAPVYNSNNNDFGKNEQVAFIEFREPDRGEDTVEIDELYEKLKKLRQIDNDDIFNISIDTSSRNNGLGGYPVSTNIFITFNNFSRAIKKGNYEKNLNDLIELLKYFKEAQDNNVLNTKFNLFDPNVEYFSPEYNHFLSILAHRIEPTAPTVNRNRKLRHFPAPKLLNNDPLGNAPPLNNTNLGRFPAPKLLNNDPPGSAPPWNPENNT